MRARNLFTWAAFLALTALVTAGATAQTFTGEVVSVADGDTVTIAANGQQVKVRLHGIDAPEGRQDRGAEATAFVERMALGQVVRAEQTDMDRYGRVVATITLPSGANLNHEIVKAGWAWWYQEYAPNDRDLALLHTDALLAKRGLWADARPIAPWEFRRGESGDTPAPATVFERAISAPDTSAPTQGLSVYVYATNTGTKYHLGHCRYLSKSKSPMGLAEAQLRGLGPCSVCKPPTETPQAPEVTRLPRGQRPQDLYNQALQQHLATQPDPGHPTDVFRPENHARVPLNLPPFKMTAIPQRNVGPVNEGPSRPQTAREKAEALGLHSPNMQTATGFKIRQEFYESENRARRGVTGGGSASHWIKEKGEDGEVLVLEDGSVWLVNRIDRFKVLTWLPYDDVTIVNDGLDTEIVNVDQGEKVSAKRVRR